jgi:hypothetical protein
MVVVGLRHRTPDGQPEALLLAVVIAGFATSGIVLMKMIGGVS